MSAPILLFLRLVMAVALYAFLGWALWVLWRELRQQADFLASRRIRMLALTDEAGKVYRFNTPVVMIGRDEHCDCPIQHPTVSAQQARLSYHHSQWWVEDLRSTNGTFLNQSPVETSLVLAAGDELRCGQVILKVTLGDET
jgi:hypothetical protein